MYLGNSDMKEEETYFLPLLPIWEERAKEEGDSALKEKVDKLSTLPSIKLLNNNNNYGFPKGESNIVSHGGYKIILKHCPNGESILSVRDIPSATKDENGRSIPYLVAIVSQTREERDTLGKLYYYILTNYKSTVEVFSKLFKYDAEKNGIAFCLSTLNDWITDVLDNKTQISQKTLEIVCNNDVVVLPNGIGPDLAIKEQQLTKSRLRMVDEDSINISDSEKKKELIEQLLNKKSANGAINEKTLTLVMALLFLGLIIGYLVMSK